MSDDQAIVRPTPSACPECGTTRVVAEGLNTVRVARADVNLLGKGMANYNSEFWALVCPNCGHTTFYAKNPARLQG